MRFCNPTAVVEGEVVDLVAIERALDGRGPVRLTDAEQRHAVDVGTARGTPSRTLADRLGMARRTVVRYRREAAA